MRNRDPGSVGLWRAETYAEVRLDLVAQEQASGCCSAPTPCVGLVLSLSCSNVLSTMRPTLVPGCAIGSTTRSSCHLPRCCVRLDGRLRTANCGAADRDVPGRPAVPPTNSHVRVGRTSFTIVFSVGSGKETDSPYTPCRGESRTRGTRTSLPVSTCGSSALGEVLACVTRLTALGPYRFNWCG